MYGSWDPPGARLLDAVAVMDRLASPGGDPWKRAQTHRSLAPYLLEESYEAYDAIERRRHRRAARGAGRRAAAGRAARAAGRGPARGRARGPSTTWPVSLVDKMVRRNPHVFAGADGRRHVDEITENWERIKQAEKARGLRARRHRPEPAGPGPGRQDPAPGRSGLEVSPPCRLPAGAERGSAPAPGIGRRARGGLDPGGPPPSHLAARRTRGTPNATPASAVSGRAPDAEVMPRDRRAATALGACRRLAVDASGSAERHRRRAAGARPGLATAAGDHRFDDRLPDLSAGRGRRDRSRCCATRPTHCPKWTPTRSTRRSRSTTRMLTALVERELFELTEVREHEWNPLAHNPGPLLHALMARPFAPAEERLTSLAGRLAAVPDALATARAVLRDCPRIHAETAVGQFAGTAALIRDEVPALLAQAPALRADGRAGRRPPRSPRWTSSPAGCAPAWPPASPGRDPRLGRRLLGGPALAHARHRADRGRGAAPGPGQPGPGHRRDRARRPPSWSAARPTTRPSAGRWTCWPPSTPTTPRSSTWPGRPWTRPPTSSASTTWSSLVDDPCVIQEMPEFARGVAVAYCDSPGPLETADVPTFYCIAPTPAGLVAGAGRVVLPRVQRPHDPQPDRARGDARPLPPARPRPPLPRPHPGPRARPSPARSSRAGRSTPRS